MCTRRVFHLGLLLFLVGACTTAPITGRRQFMLISESTEIAEGEAAYRDILRQSVISHEAEAARIVRKVGERIARVANKPNYQWEFNVIDDPEMANAFAVPGGKVAVYTGIFPAAKDEAGLAVVLGHEVAHALARHGAERMSQSMVVQLGAVGLGVGFGNPQVLQAYGLGTALGIILPFSRSQELEADRIGLRLMAEAGYDPRASLELWQRMEKEAAAKGQEAPPGFLSTHPGYEKRTEQLRAWLPEALKFYRPSNQAMEALPSLASLDSPNAQAERELLKRIQAVNQLARNAGGQRAVLETLGYELRISPTLLAKELQQVQLDFGHYSALKGVTHLGRGSLSQVLATFKSNASWTDISRRHGTQITDLLRFMRQLLTTASRVQGQLRYRAPMR